METIHLKAESYDEFYSACYHAGIVNDGEIITASHDYSIDLIGVLRKPTGKMLTDEEGNEYPETKALDGYHANLRAKSPVGIEHLSVRVNNPLRAFA